MRLSASRLVLISGVAIAFGIACSGNSYTTDPQADGQVGGSGGDGETGGDGSSHDGGTGNQGDGGQSSSVGGSASGGETSSGGSDGTGGSSAGGGASSGGSNTGGSNTGGSPGTGGVISTGGTGTGGIGTGGVISTGGVINTGGTGGSGAGGGSVGGSPTTGGSSSGGGSGTGGAGTGGSSGGTVCPVVEYACPKAVIVPNQCASDQTAFEEALQKARGCSATSQCSGKNEMADACGCPYTLNDERCDLVDAARYAYFVWTVCHQCDLPACPLSIIDQCNYDAAAECSSTSNTCERKGGAATE